LAYGTNLFTGECISDDRGALAIAHRPLRTASTHRAVVKTLRNWRANRIQNEAAGITQPTLLIWGDSDKDTPVEMVKYFARQF